jgi:uncharacterized membrane protein
MSNSMDSSHGDIRPVPDPTALTTEASIRLEIMLRNLIQSEILHQNDLFSERFMRIDTRFNMLDARTAEQKQDTTNALNAALAAQKEAVAAQTASSEKSITKSETATTERIKGVETLLSTSTKATDDKITDLKDRIIAIEARKQGATEETENLQGSSANIRGNMASIISVVTTLIAIISIIIAIFMATKH